MKPCKGCGAELSPSARFCPDCGLAVDIEQEDIASFETVSGLVTDIPMDKRTKPPFGPKELVALEAGAIIAEKFRIERVLGQGGMGRVYLATEMIANGERERAVALKVISQKYANNEKAIQRLLDEGLLTQELAHKNIVRVYDIGMHGTQPYIAMEYIEGRPLHVWRSEKMARDETVPVKVAGKIIEEVLLGLEAAHDAGIIHRDLKPENIMLIGEPSQDTANVRIVDFGVALATKTADTGSGTGLGTQQYMAPEQLRNANAATASADLYSVSRIFYELIVGVLPSGHWQPPSGGRSDVPSGIDALIEKGLALNRAMRPQSAAEYRAVMVKAFDKPAPPKPNPFKLGGDKKEIEEARSDLKAAYIRMFKAIPVWGWITIAIAVGVLALVDLEDTQSPPQNQYCGYDAYGNYVCQ